MATVQVRRRILEYVSVSHPPPVSNSTVPSVVIETETAVETLFVPVFTLCVDSVWRVRRLCDGSGSPVMRTGANVRPLFGFC